MGNRKSLSKTPESRLLIDRITKKVSEAVGHDLCRYRQDHIDRRLHTAFTRSGCRDWDNFLEWISGPAFEIGLLQDLFPVKHSAFFRDVASFDNATVLLSHLSSPNGAPLKLLSLGCGQGQEAYSLAICCEEAVGGGVDWRIIGVDLDKAALLYAQRGVYSRLEVRQVPEETLQKYFRVCLCGKHKNASYELIPELKMRCGFMSADFVKEVVEWAPCPDSAVTKQIEIPAPGSISFVSCRYVLVYLNENAAAQLLKNLVRYLAFESIVWVGEGEHIHDFGKYGLSRIGPSFYRFIKQL